MAYEVTLTIVAGERHNLFDAQETGCQKVTGFFHSESSEILSRREPGFSFEKMRKVRKREISYVSQFGQHDPSMKIGVHEVDHGLNSRIANCAFG